MQNPTTPATSPQTNHHNPINTSPAISPQTNPHNPINTSPPQQTINIATSSVNTSTPILPIVQLPQINPLPKEILPPVTISQHDSRDCRVPSPGDSNQPEMQQCVVSRMATFPNSPPSPQNLSYIVHAEGMECDDSGLSGTPQTTATSSKISPKSVRKKKGSKKRRGGL
ncbi:hypothetical protein OIU76_000045 [Salix suchowensis]|nr:hypothetical protein OIU76_000045 [Salix suchowensis]